MKSSIQKLSRHAPPAQVVRFVVVGVWNTLAGYAIFALFAWLLLPHIANDKLATTLAGVLSTVVGINISFFSHKIYVFKTKGNVLRQYLRAYVVYGTTLVVTVIALPVIMTVLDLLGTSRTYSSFLAGGIVTVGTVVISFFGHKRYTFQIEPAEDSELCTRFMSDVAPNERS